ncbi:hypothetical protein PPTG_01126 [Phytophthora nicotianae INRA-310]|uniref:DUF659 domain-containing protein n=1 Tax=Phytophthora nicotianae (strain INRA-310) TaxID=761204 RepID=W2RK23_PHYN3|nr:hypothetical protein PPTG_01126 [Phytophthora nicotianae INRA-310]ETN24965.1 hypothetical protein PPTG_01126 [Phytophthora nicotianae INRA-310]
MGHPASNERLEFIDVRSTAETAYLALDGLFATGSRHDGVAIAEQMKGLMVDMQKKGWKIGAMVTDNVGSVRPGATDFEPQVAYYRCCHLFCT